MYKNRDDYKNHIESIRNRPILSRTLILADKILTLTGFLMYPVLLACLFFRQRDVLPVYILLPAIFFLALSLARKKMNRPRPYEYFDTPALVDKDTRGCSFPSRHVFSLSLIAVLWLGIMKPVGFLLLAAAFLLAVIRVMIGVHFFRDVSVGMILGILCGLITILISF